MSLPVDVEHRRVIIARIHRARRGGSRVEDADNNGRSSERFARQRWRSRASASDRTKRGPLRKLPRASSANAGSTRVSFQIPTSARRPSSDATTRRARARGRRPARRARPRDGVSWSFDRGEGGPPPDVARASPGRARADRHRVVPGRQALRARAPRARGRGRAPRLHRRCSRGSPRRTRSRRTRRAMRVHARRPGRPRRLRREVAAERHLRPLRRASRPQVRG